MQELLPYSTTIYDANVIVYLCSWVRDKDEKGIEKTIRRPETMKASRITLALVRANKRITTLRAAWKEAENILPGHNLAAWLKEGTIQREFGLPGEIPPVLRLKLAQQLKLLLAKFRQNNWFSVDEKFAADRPAVEKFKRIYAEFCLDPEMQKRIRPYKGTPSDVDIELSLYSADRRMPMLTNDSDLFEFKDELKSLGLCELIRPFHEVKIT